jgi:hypothetical protein
LLWSDRDYACRVDRLRQFRNPGGRAMSPLSACRRRRTRRPVAWTALVLMLVQQIALAAYICPVAAPPAEPMPMMAECAEMEAPDPAAPALCHEHCLRDHLATPDLKLLQAPPLAFHVVHIALVDTPLPPADGTLYEDVPICQSDPPLSLRFCSLLI